MYTEENLIKMMEAATLSKTLNISLACADDVIYLRSRQRHTPELEQELIALHKAGTPPNIFEFGCTEATGKALLEEAIKQVNKI